MAITRTANTADAPRPPLGKAAAELYQSTRQQLSQILELFTLEVRYSGLMLGWTAALAVSIAVTTVSFWGLVQAAGVAWLLSINWSWSAALGLMALLNVGVLALCLYLIHRALQRVGLENTRKALSLDTNHVSDHASK